MILYCLIHSKIREDKLSTRIINIYHTKKESLDEFKTQKAIINRDWEIDGEIPKEYIKEKKQDSYRIHESLFNEEDYLKIEKIEIL
jgi:hypothetical protein